YTTLFRSPDVVSGFVVPGRLQQPDRPTAQAQHHRGRRDVAPRLVLRKAERRSRRVKLLDLIAEHPPRHVEVVDELVDELPAGGLDRKSTRRQRVAARHIEAVHGAELPRAHAPARLPKTGIEASLKA